jgi:hypothetical protein
MAKAKPRFGTLKPRYRFALNPIPEVRWSRCPRCEKLMHERKFPLLILVGDRTLIALGKTCRYCTPCEFIIAHQHELEDELVYACEQRGHPEMIGAPYGVIGTVQREHWKASLQGGGGGIDAFRACTADIKSYHTLNDPRPRWVRTEPPSDAGPR